MDLLKSVFVVTKAIKCTPMTAISTYSGAIPSRGVDLESALGLNDWQAGESLAGKGSSDASSTAASLLASLRFLFRVPVNSREMIYV